MRHLLDALKIEDDEVLQMRQWVEQAAETMNHSQRNLGFWIQLMLSDLPKAQATPAPDRVLDVHGWHFYFTRAVI